MLNYSRIIGEVMVLMKKPSVSESPLRQGTRTCRRWDLAEIEACGGGKVLSETPGNPAPTFKYFPKLRKPPRRRKNAFRNSGKPCHAEEIQKKLPQ